MNYEGVLQKMGSGSSVPRCPSSCDKRDFSAILRLYDDLDANGDFEVESAEVQKIAEIHVANKIMIHNRDVRHVQVRKTLTVENAKRRLNNEISAIKSACFTKIQDVTRRSHATVKKEVTKYDAEADALRDEIRRLEIASPPEKQRVFVSAVSVDDRISFKEFFKYMRNRTENLRELYPDYYGETDVG